jgi:flavin reductase (DIM6/NTAB) family NADH-FMN oxidoreductase RutF
MSENASSDALKMIPYGFYAIGSQHDGDENIMVLNWLMQASFEPQLIAIGLMKNAYSYALIEKSGSFTVNLFSQTDKEALMPFTKGRAKNPDKMLDAKTSPSPNLASPVLESAAAFLECKVVNKLDTGGDHDIILAEVIHAEVRTQVDAADLLSLPGIGWSYAG